MIRRFVEDTLDLLVDMLAKLGIVRGDTYWVRKRLHRRLFGEGEAGRGAAANARSRYKVCTKCNALNSKDQRTCSQCGARLPGPVASSFGAVLNALVPSIGSVSMTVVGIIAALYLATAVAAPEEGRLLSPSFEILSKLGAMRADRLILEGQWWRLVNPIFLHGGLLHIGFNAYVLSAVGPLVEAYLGRRKFFALFMAGGIASFVLSAVAAVFISPRLSVGASGALFGLFGYGIVEGYRRGSGVMRQAAPQLLLWAGINFVLGLSIGVVDNAAHLGGLIAGALFALAVSPYEAMADRHRLAWGVATVVGVVLPILGFLLAILSD
jgi:rhomboid protease GluP